MCCSKSTSATPSTRSTGLRSSVKRGSACRACHAAVPRNPIELRGGSAARKPSWPPPVCSGLAASPPGCLLGPYRLAAFRRGGLPGRCVHGRYIPTSQRWIGPLDRGSSTSWLTSKPCQIRTGGLWGGAAASVDLAFFPNGMPFNQSGAFSLLGAPIGDAGFCNEFTAAEWVNKALPLLEELAVLDDAQTTLLLLRQCASYCRMVYSTRVTPPRGLAPALQSFDTAVHGCLEAGCSGPLTPEAWMQASLSTRSGGLGLRSVARHGVAGYAASLLATAPCAKTSMATMMQTRAPPCTRSTSRSHLPTTSRSQPRTLLGNKSCHARWTGL